MLLAAGTLVNLIEWWHGSAFAWWSLALSTASVMVFGPIWLDASLTKTRWTLVIGGALLTVAAMIGVASNAQRRAPHAHSYMSSDHAQDMPAHMP